MSALPPKADIAFYGARRAKGWRWRNANSYGLRDRRRDRSRYPQRHSMASRNAAAARAERVFRWVRPRDARRILRLGFTDIAASSLDCAAGLKDRFPRRHIIIVVE
jgi:hypothetical protein